jgi:hypothetical protein
MYALTFRHPNGNSTLTWEFDVPYDTLLFVNYDGQMAEGFELKGSYTCLMINHGPTRLLELSFSESKMMFFLRLMRGNEVIRELYLREDDLVDEHAFAIDYPTDSV